ncbi:MAG: hypothetical protein CMI27_02785 [Opitutae bacterium]|nr:hypothetical protein [Opitutae bacterium]
MKTIIKADIIQLVIIELVTKGKSSKTGSADRCKPSLPPYRQTVDDKNTITIANGFKGSHFILIMMRRVNLQLPKNNLFAFICWVMEAINNLKVHHKKNL